jgi:hypothetical protein
MKKIIVIFLSILSLQAMSQETKSFFSFCDKSGNITMTRDEFSNCKKELVSSEANLVITSFKVSILKEGVFTEYKITGNTFSGEALDAIVKSSGDKTFNGKILIEDVKVKGVNSERERVVPGMVITIK